MLWQTGCCILLAEAALAYRFRLLISKANSDEYTVTEKNLYTSLYVELFLSIFVFFLSFFNHFWEIFVYIPFCLQTFLIVTVFNSAISPSAIERCM